MAYRPAREGGLLAEVGDRARANPKGSCFRSRQYYDVYDAIRYGLCMYFMLRYNKKILTCHKQSIKSDAGSLTFREENAYLPAREGGLFAEVGDRL